MQKVSKSYKESMKSSLRERSYIMLSFGLINQEAQAKARIDKGDFTYYSREDTIFGEHKDDIVYATLEENFTKIDGNMYFLPRQSTADRFYDTGLVSKDLISDSKYELTIDLHIAAIDFKGLTIHFGENYPVDFDLVGSTGQIIEFRGNNQAQWSTEEVLENTTFVKLIFYKMKNYQSRLRIYSIRFGYGLVYYNDSVMNSTLESYVSPIGADVPQIDFSVQLKNYDGYFNVDNPKSAINFLETGQEMEIYYGYQLPESGEIEWLKGNHLLCSDWESDDSTITIRCQDVFRNMDSEYYKGSYEADGKSYYSIAQEIFDDLGWTDYYIDPHLKTLRSKNPMPRVTHKEALQIIANACRCVLTQTRQGTILIKSNFQPDISIRSNGETTYSNILNVMNEAPKSEYATLSMNYTTSNGTMYFLPKNGVGNLYTGYISEVQSDKDGLFESNPMVTVELEAAHMYYGVRFDFGHALPSEFVIRTYNDGKIVTERTVREDEISKSTIILHDFDDFDKMIIEFIKTAEPFNHIVLNYFSLGDITNFTMNRQDMTSSPKAIKQELVKEVIVPCLIYQRNTQEETLVSEEVTVESGDIVTYYLENPAYQFRVTLSGSEEGVRISDSGSYYITIQYEKSGTFRLDIFGCQYKIVKKYAIKSLNNRGKSIKWENPLISDMTMAKDLAGWLGEYYQAGIEYEYDTRGNPEIDANDIIYQENEFLNRMRVNVYHHTIRFKQSLSGSVKARRVGG